MRTHTGTLYDAFPLVLYFVNGLVQLDFSNAVEIYNLGATDFSFPPSPPLPPQVTKARLVIRIKCQLFALQDIHQCTYD